MLLPFMRLERICFYSLMIFWIWPKLNQERQIFKSVKWSLVSLSRLPSDNLDLWPNRKELNFPLKLKKIYPISFIRMNKRSTKFSRILFQTPLSSLKKDRCSYVLNLHGLPRILMNIFHSKSPIQALEFPQIINSLFLKPFNRKMEQQVEDTVAQALGYL